MITATMIVLVLTTVTSGLTAGLFWAFGYAVMPALRRTDDRTCHTIAFATSGIALLAY